MDLSNIKIAHTTETIKEDFLGVTLEIARGNNVKFKAKFEETTKPYTAKMRHANMDEELSKELLCKALAGTVLIGWEGFHVDGEEVPFSNEIAEALLYNDDDCRAFVMEVSKDFTRFLDDVEDEIAKK